MSALIIATKLTGKRINIAQITLRKNTGGLEDFSEINKLTISFLHDY